jgi:hypothetical protein
MRRLKKRARELRSARERSSSHWMLTVIVFALVPFAVRTTFSLEVSPIYRVSRRPSPTMLQATASATRMPSTAAERMPPA